MGHREATRDDLTGCHIHDHAAGRLVRPPTLRHIGGPQAGYVLHSSLVDREAVEMAAIFGSANGGDELGLPTRHEVVPLIERAQAGKERIANPQLVAAKAHLVAVNVAGEMSLASEQARIVL